MWSVTPGRSQGCAHGTDRAGPGVRGVRLGRVPGPARAGVCSLVAWLPGPRRGVQLSRQAPGHAARQKNKREAFASLFA